ncbi:glycosyltransferase [Solibacillus isronensis]|uniref:glycosyltransferase n=1 Tax=Solibacillus isronensis TaxID=412383 RepID=UPI0020416E9D|nr:glycosyltransferase [Solibacillus isronensis]MCM3722104.1 glycosyltransferase [Solibacillus isronensis]
MKILFVAEHLSYGGAPRRFIDLANAMVDRGIDTTIFVFNGSIEIKDKVNSAIKCIERKSIKPPNSWLSRNIFYRLKCIQIINNYLKINKYDIVVSFNDMVNISVLLSKNARKSKIVISERSDPNYNKKILQIVKKIIYQNAKGIVFQTKGAQEFFGSKVKVKSVVIPNPIPSNVTFEPYTGEPEKIIVNVARLWLFQKRQDVLIKAFKVFSQKHPDYKLVLYGDGPDELVIKQLVKDLKLESKVVFAGVTSNVIEAIKKARLFVLTSDFEGIPNALIEAMAIGLPVISTDCSPGGSRLLIKSKENGILIKCGDINELLNAMEDMVSDPDKSYSMGHKARDVVNLLDEKRIYDIWLNYFYDVANN